MEKISVIIPLFNKEHCICKTIESVLNQTHTYFELIIVNDGSTDHSLDLAKSYQDKRIRIIDKENEGVSMTRNRGAKEADSELLLFLDADDYLYPYCLEILSDLHSRYPTFDLWSANYTKMVGDIKYTVLSDAISGFIDNPYKLIYEKKWNFRPGSFIITKKSFFERGGFPSHMTVGEDWYFMDMYCEKFRCVYTPISVMSYIQEYRALSKSDVNLNMTIEWHYIFQGKNRWQKMSYSENIFKRVVISVMRLNFRHAIALIRKYHIWNFIGFFSAVISYMKSRNHDMIYNDEES